MNRFPRLDILPAAQRTLWVQLTDINRHSYFTPTPTFTGFESVVIPSPFARCCTSASTA